MELAVIKGFEMGTHMVPFEFESPLCWVFWLALAFGFLVQVVLQRKRRVRFVWIALLLAGLVGCEIACQVITGWDLILWVVLYFYLLTMLAGALLEMLIHYVRQRNRK